MVTMLTSLGLTILIANYFIAFLLLYKARDGNSPDKKPVRNVGTLIVGKVFFAGVLAWIASTPGVGPFTFVNDIVSTLHSLGAYYFIISLVLDMILAKLFAVLEYNMAFAIVLGNLPCIPMVSALASAVALLEQWLTIRKIKEDFKTDKKAQSAILGTVSKVVRLVEQPVRTGSDNVQLRTRIVVRKVPGSIKVRYAPTVEGGEFNPHMIIAGESGTGKTTTTYCLVTQLIKYYSVILFDVKGDLTKSLHANGFVDTGHAEIYMVSRTGIDPFKPVVENETDSQMVEDLMDSISVIEEVGSKQAHFIRTAHAEIRITRGTLTYENLLGRIEKLSKDVMKGRVKYGPQTRDAIEGIYDKLHDLNTVFRSAGVSLAEIYSPLLEGRPKLIVLNISDMSEKNRAIVLEFMLRKLAKIMARRGPLAFVNKPPIVTVIDEAYIVAKPILLRGGRDAGSRSILENIARTGRSHGLALILVTQKLSDIADGIRQSFYRWVVFNTRSEDDMRILSQTAPLSIKEIIKNLERGEAYIRLLIPSRMSSLSRQDEARVIVEGYVFEMWRHELKSSEGKEEEKTGPLSYCSTCGRVLTTDGKCLGKHGQPAIETANSTRTTDAAAETKDAISEKDEEVKEEKNEKERIGYKVGIALAARRIAIKKAQDKEVAETLEKIPCDIVVRFCDNWKDMQYGKLFCEYGLLKIADGKPRKTAAGNLLLKMFQELIANE